MKNFLEKHWAVIVWVLTVVIDKEYGLAETIFSEAWQISLFQILGTLALSYKWNPAIKESFAKKVIASDKKTGFTQPDKAPR